MASSAQDAYLNSVYPGTTPHMSGADAMFNWYTGSWDSKVENWQADRREWQENKLLQQAQWERDDEYYQRLVRDMTKAGLNPYYALNQGLISGQSSSAIDRFKSRREDEKKKDDNMKGLFVTAILLAKLLFM